MELRVRHVADSTAGPRHRYIRHAAHEETTVRLLAERDREAEHARPTPVGEHLDVPATQHVHPGAAPIVLFLLHHVVDAREHHVLWRPHEHGARGPALRKNPNWPG